MKVIITSSESNMFEFNKVLQLSTVFVGDDEDSQKYNTTVLVWLNYKGKKLKTTFLSSEISMCVVTEEGR